MTACVNNEKKAKGGALAGKVARTFLAGALAATMVPSIALAEPAGQDGEASALAAQAPVANAFKDGTFSWNVEKNADGEYVVSSGDSFYLTGITDTFGRPVSISDVTVLYVADADKDGELDSGDNSSKVYTDSTELPVSEYVALVINGAYDGVKVDSGTTTYSQLTGLGSYETATQAFEVVGRSLDGAYAIQGTDTSDTQFKYLGTDIEFTIADAAGNALEPLDSDNGNNSTADYQIIWTSKPAGASVTLDNGKATIGASGWGDITGTYKFTAKGLGDYAGSQAEVTFTVDKIDLASDEITVAPQKTGSLFSSGKLSDTSIVLVNGEKTANGLFEVEVVGGVDGSEEAIDPSTYAGSSVAVVNAVVSIANGGGNFVDEKATIDLSIPVVTNLTSFKYDGVDIAATDGVATTSPLKTFVTSEGQSFKTSLLEAYHSTDKYVDIDSVVVEKDGTVTTDYSAPGLYTVTAKVNPSKDLSYAGYITFKFQVVEATFSSQPKVYAEVDGKDFAEAANPGIEYDGEAVVPTIVAKDGNETLVEGTDYTVSYEDKDGNAVESMVEPGDYTVVVDFGDGKYRNPGGSYTSVENVEFAVKITKAKLESAEADEPVYAWTGEPVSPIFTAWTDKDCKGLSVAVDPAKTGVTYYKAVVDPKTGEPAVVGYNAAGEVASTSSSDTTVAFTGWEYDATQKLSASDVKDEGFYVAFVTAPADDPHFQGTAVQAAQFEVSEYAKYEDVDASEWYATPVYQARDLGYMTGVAGTKLFMPGADVSREQVASVLFRMAGQDDGQSSSILPYFPTRFSDVDGWAWYAEAVSWAAQAGVMNGYAGTDVFGVSEDATREELACIFYNYARSQGKDVSVDDADAALAAYADGDSVSAWAKEAVAWAVENGVMGNGGIERFRPQDPISRAEVAAMAVNFQPEALK